MPEALAIVFVLTTCAVCYVAARLHARNPQVWNAHQELKRLEVRCVSLESRMETAARENWDAQMRRAVADELRSTRMQLAHMRAEMDDVVARD
jgi:hypothetical protein